VASVIHSALSIGRSRALYGGRDSATLEREAGLLQLLTEIDGFDTKAAAGGDQEMVGPARHWPPRHRHAF